MWRSSQCGLIDFLISKKQEDRRIFNTEKDIREWYQYFVEPASLVNKQSKKCGVGYDRLSISYKGDVSLGCAFFGHIGNIKENNIKDIWLSPKAKKIRKLMLQCKFPCTSNCYKELTFKQKVAKVKVFVKSGLFNKK